MTDFLMMTRPKGSGCGCKKPAGSGGSGDVLLDMETQFQSMLTALSVPTAELPAPPYSWETWADAAQTTARARQRELIRHALQTVKHIRGGAAYQGSVHFTLSNLLDHAYRFAHLWARLNSETSSPISADLTLRVAAATLGAAAEWYPLAYQQAFEEGRKKGHEQGYVAGWQAAYEARRNVVSAVLELLNKIVDKGTETAQKVAEEAAEVAKKGAEEAGKAAPWIAAAVVAVAAIVLRKK